MGRSCLRRKAGLHGKMMNFKEAISNEAKFLRSSYDLDVTRLIFKVGEKDVLDVFTMKSWFV